MLALCAALTPSSNTHALLEVRAILDPLYESLCPLLRSVYLLTITSAASEALETSAP